MVESVSVLAKGQEKEEEEARSADQTLRCRKDFRLTLFERLRQVKHGRRKTRESSALVSDIVALFQGPKQGG